MQAVTKCFGKDKRFRCKTRSFSKWVAFMKKEAHSRVRNEFSKARREYLKGNLEAEISQPMPVSGYDVC